MPQVRSNPENILKRIQEENKNKNLGRLKIFFGYAAGVGKTYAMLQAARDVQKQGIDVVVGYIEPHTRPETMSLLEGLEVLQTLKLDHNGIVLNEFDLDRAIERKPQLILVDELAHTNEEKCRHIKRYKDIEELLNAGIDVYTTVNVQHIESLNDIVASITGVIVRERIPDYVFDNADQVELVDIEPEDLISRLNKGKIYKEIQAQKALNNFFSINNLIALREIALRRTADHVNKISEKKSQFSSKADYYTGEHILICLSPAPSNAKVIRAAARMAYAFKGTFTALFVETSSFANMSPKDKEILRSNLRLAQQLGAVIETVYGEDIAFQIAEFARLSRVSRVIIGRTNTKGKLLFTKSFKLSFAERLTEFAPNLDIYIIPDKVSSPYKETLKRRQDIYSFSVIDFLKSVFILIAATLIGLSFQNLGFSEANIITVYILGVLVIAVVTPNKLYSTFSSIISVLIFNFLFTHPKYSLMAYDTGYPVTFIVMFLSAFITSTLTTRIKKQAKLSAQMAYRTKILLETNQRLQQSESIDSIISETASQLVKLLDKTIIIYTVNKNELSQPKVFPNTESKDDSTSYTSENEKAVAQWVYKNNKHAGATTNTLNGARCLYLAVRGKENVYAVVGIEMGKDHFDAFENNLVISILGECALIMEKDILARTKEQTAIEAQQEKLRANLLRSISHDLRTPLTGISGNAGILFYNSESLDEGKKKKLYEDIYDDSLWLINLVENLLSVTRIKDGTMNINMEGELLEEVIAEALRHVNRKSIEHTIKVKNNDDLVMAKMDSRLIIQVIINIVDNAIKYTPKGSTIIISYEKKKDVVVVEVSDDGQGISEEGKKNLFKMFYTANNSIADSHRGLGLGLALCKSIITAHGGTMSVKDNKPKGSVFSFTLRAEEVNIYD